MKYTPLVVALLASFPALTPQLALAAETAPAPASAPAATPEQNVLPDLGTPAPTQQGNTSVRPGPGGIAFESTFDQQKVLVTPEYSDQTGLSPVGCANSFLCARGIPRVYRRPSLPLSERITNHLKTLFALFVRHDHNDRYG
ncbi:hypothetical protein [Propionivibrio sp.]|uniref:hypothetical protein n=1 Tax=Propionivibrio sp. TaxID=2212460 RepID=UPI003BF05822